jgi:hypothetical protein
VRGILAVKECIGSALILIPVLAVRASRDAQACGAHACKRVSVRRHALVPSLHRQQAACAHASCVCVCVCVCARARVHVRVRVRVRVQHRPALLSLAPRHGAALTRLAGKANACPADVSGVPDANALDAGAASLARLNAHACDTRRCRPSSPVCRLVIGDVAPLQSQLSVYSLCMCAVAGLGRGGRGQGEEVVRGSGEGAGLGRGGGRTC